jgi:hypothetical protein
MQVANCSNLTPDWHSAIAPGIEIVAAIEIGAACGANFNYSVIIEM